MLTTLRIKNLALVDDLTLELQPGFNAITGETGAGKSVIIGAMNLVLGERADRTLIRSGAESCTVESVFDVSRLPAAFKAFLETNGLEPCEDSQLVLKRTFTSSGANRQFINGSPVTLAALASLGEWLVDMHGPHDHQSLLHPARQLDLLDAYGNISPAHAAFAQWVRQRTALESEKASLIGDEKSFAQQMDLLRFQVSEITAARLQPSEETELASEYQRASNAARLLELCQTAQNLLGEEEPSVLTQMGSLGRALHDLGRIDPSSANLATLHQQSLDSLLELQHDLERYADHVEIDPERLRELEERTNLVHSLKRKYGATVAEIIEFGEEAASKLQRLEQRDGELARIQAEMKKLDIEITRAGKELSAQRRQVIPQLSKAVSKQLRELGFKQSHFDVALQSETDLSKFKSSVPLSGFDTVEFQFAPNPGEPPRSLRGIASSGEMARVMLAIKTVLASQDQIPVLVFDEVDANVGGETANAVGEKMRQIASQRQVLCITHLAPVAASASAHYLVSKEVKAGRTLSKMELLDAEQRVTELARMLGGQSQAARQHAQALLQG